METKRRGGLTPSTTNRKMTTFKHKEYTVNICTTQGEWVDEFYSDVPEGAILHVDDTVKECSGFAQAQDKEIWVYAPDGYSLKDLKATVAHEIGHCVELKFPKNPPAISEEEHPDWDVVLNELKAEFYQEFYITVDEIVEKAVHCIIRRK